MRSFGIIHIFLLLLLLLTYLWADGQDYILTAKGDSIAGTLKPLSFGVEKKVQVTDVNKKKQTFAIFQVKEYRFKGELYRPIKGPDGYTFMKVVRNGYLSLYYYQLPNQVTYDGTYMQKMDGKGIDVPNLAFKKAMKNFLKDCDAVVDRIEAGELAKKNLNEIIDEYNQCISNNTVSKTKAIAERVEQKRSIGPWDVLEEKVKSETDFDGKQNALDMIQEIKGKISRSEKIPNFLIEGLKSSLIKDAFKEPLEAALKEVN
ncbi:MAG: hypothetical protein ABJA70_03115 [Chryseolinea sp.]